MAFLRVPVLLLALFLSSSLFVQHASAAKYVFAQHRLSYTKSHTQSTWANDIDMATQAGIDAFSLQVTYPDTDLHVQIAHAFAAAEALDSEFKLFFAFDYVNGDAWPTDAIVSLLQNYTTSPAYFWFTEDPDDFPFISTRGGYNYTFDWGQYGDVRTNFGPFYFVPDWSNAHWEDLVGAGSSLPPQGWYRYHMWPLGATNKTDTDDREYVRDVTDETGKTYMMGVSPWFFHSAHPGKNWVWRGDDLWHTRWGQTLDPKVNPKFVQIVSWNDFGSSHYIGPIHFKSEVPATSVAYLQSHDAWRDFLPYYIAKYKKKAYTIGEEQVMYWYIRAPTAGGSTCGVVGNNADDGQTEVPANDVVEDGIFFSALLIANATVSVKIGNFPATTYAGVAGINHWSRPFNGQTGVPYISLVRDGVKIGHGLGMKEITAKTILANGCTNYNPWVGSFTPTL